MEALKVSCIQAQLSGSYNYNYTNKLTTNIYNKIITYSYKVLKLGVKG